MSSLATLLLCSISGGRLREANKPQLGDEIAAVAPKSALESFAEERTVTHVLDGG